MYAQILKFAGWLIIVVGAVSAALVSFLAVSASDAGLAAPLVVLVSIFAALYVGFIGLGLLAVSQLILVAVAIEENTRSNAAWPLTLLNAFLPHRLLVDKPVLGFLMPGFSSNWIRASRSLRSDSRTAVSNFCICTDEGPTPNLGDLLRPGYRGHVDDSDFARIVQNPCLPDTPAV